MALQDQHKWNSRYLENSGGAKPSAIVSRYASLACPGAALDIACGNGRNTEFLAREGFQVDAVDISDVALARLPANDPRINTICRDLDTWQIPPNRYQLIINIRFLDRRLFPMIKEALMPGGVLIFESFVHENKAYCLKPDELRHAFGGFRMVYYEEKANDPSDRFDQSVCMVAVNHQKKG